MYLLTLLRIFKVRRFVCTPLLWQRVYMKSYRFHLRAIDDNFQFSCACVPFEYFNLGGGANISIYFMSLLQKGFGTLAVSD